MIRFICFVQVKSYSNSLTSLKIAKIKSHGKVTDCFDAGLFLTFCHEYVARN